MVYLEAHFDYSLTYELLAVSVIYPFTLKFTPWVSKMFFSFLSMNEIYRITVQI